MGLEEIGKRNIHEEVKPFRDNLQNMFYLLKEKRPDAELYDLLAKSFTREADDYLDDFLKGIKTARERKAKA